MKDLAIPLLRLSFNTGRPYTVDGQHIDAIQAADGYIYFYDRSRLITGRINVRHCPSDSLEALRGRVMDVYDRTAYEPATIPQFEQLWAADRR